MAERENPLAVRWDTEHEEVDIFRLLDAVADDFAIYLDRNGWQITLKRSCKVDSSEEDLWPMNQKTTATPLWATDMFAHNAPEKKIAYRPYPNAAENIFGFVFGSGEL